MSFLRSDVFHIPFEFRNLPEAEVVRQAESEFKAAAEREGKAMAASGQKFHVVTNDYQRAQRNLKRAEDAFDTAAGLPIPAPPTPKVIDEVSRFFPLAQRKEVLALLEKRCGRTIPFERDASSDSLDRYRLKALRETKGNLDALRKWIDAVQFHGREML